VISAPVPNLRFIICTSGQEQGGQSRDCAACVARSGAAVARGAVKQSPRGTQPRLALKPL